MDSDFLIILLYVFAIVCAILVAALVDSRIKFLRLRQKNYFLNRDRERYAETIYASKDGYFAFIYPDEYIRDPRKSVKERCSRRLAVMLDLKNGRASSFEDILDVFYKEDARKIKKYLNLMQEDGIAFEDTFQLKNIKRKIRILGNRINGADGNLYCDMLWFRDLSIEQQEIEKLKQNVLDKNLQIKVLQDLINHVDFPLYVRNEQMDIVSSNKRYTMLFEGQQGAFEQWQKSSYLLAQKALQTNQVQRQNIQIILKGEACYFEICEAPFHNTDELEKMGTVGYLTDVTAFDRVKRDFKTHQNAHLEVLSSLGTAFAIFDTKAELIFYNKAFRDIWHLKAEILDHSFSYTSFLNTLRTNRMLPEVSDFKAYKAEEEKLFDTLIEPKEQLFYLPDGRTLRRLVSPHPNGLIFAYEDVSDRLAAERTINELMSVQQGILNHISDAVLIFGQNGKLRYFNDSYVKMFEPNLLVLQNLLSAMEVFEMQKKYFTKVENWENLKKHMFRHIFDICSNFKLECDNGEILDVSPVILADESVMICYKRQ